MVRHVAMLRDAVGVSAEAVVERIVVAAMAAAFCCVGIAFAAAIGFYALADLYGLQIARAATAVASLALAALVAVAGRIRARRRHRAALAARQRLVSAAHAAGVAAGERGRSLAPAAAFAAAFLLGRRV